MKFLDKIVGETIVICGASDRVKILSRKKLLNIKVMDIREFMKKYLFDYDESAIIFLMDKYGYKYEIAKEYIDNLYYIEDKDYGVFKLDFLVSLKRELTDSGLLKYNRAFREYLKSVKVLVYGIRLGKFELDLFKDVDYKYIEKDYHEYSHEVYSFKTIEDEVYYTALEICKLIDNGVSIKNVKLTNIDSSYYNTIVRIFTLFGLKVNIPYQSPLSSFKYVKEFIDNYKENDLDYAVSLLDVKNKLYDKVIEVINKYLKYDSKELLLYKLEHTNIDSYQYDNGIEIINFLEYQARDTEYVFMLGFNDGVIPNSYKDIDYITDNIKDLIHMDTTIQKNINLRKEIIKAIGDIKNLVITYKERDTKKTFYPSSLCALFTVKSVEIDDSVSYSEIYSKINLMRGIDNYIKYGYKGGNFSKLYSNFKVQYNSYNNEYSMINRIMDKLTLSYSKMQIYNKCAFRYYLTDILKLDIYEENFAAVIGTVLHYVMEKCLANNDMDTDKYVMECLGDRELTNKERFFLEKYKASIKDMLGQIMLEREYGSFDKALYEEKIDIDYGNDIKFTGVIDKVLYKEDNDKTYVALVDYKTGVADISLEYLNYGLNMQLPIYLYLSSYLGFRNILYSGFYLQKFNITEGDYRLVGYSNSDKDILSVIDSGYDNSKIIKSMRTLKDGSFSRYTKVLSNEEIERIKEITKEKIEEAIENIRSNRFEINPKVCDDKVIGCEFCKFKDICFVKKKDRVEIEKQEFGGGSDGLDE